MLIKERDAHVDERGTDALPDDSIYSGLLVDQLPHSEVREAEIVGRARELGAQGDAPVGKALSVMLATSRDEPFTKDGWIFELKYDGYRLIASGTDAGPTLWSRNGNDLTETFPDIARAVRGLPYEGVILDGEVVVTTRTACRASVASRGGGACNAGPTSHAPCWISPPPITRSISWPSGDSTCGTCPCWPGRSFFARSFPPSGPIRYSDHIETQGEAMYAQVTEMGLEGIVAKKADSRYRAGRSTSWYKIRTVRMGDFVVVGYTDPKGGRPAFGALHLAQYVDGELTYAGSVGTGFDDDELEKIKRIIDELELTRTEAEPEAPMGGGAVPRGASHHWIRPELVAEVRFKEFTEGEVIRHPSFLRIRDDKRPKDCVRELAASGHEDAPDPVPITDQSVERTVHFTNLDKVFWPSEGYTKGDLIEYYRVVWPWIKPYLAGRCLVLTRYPDGIDGKSFYQKNAPDWALEWIRTETVWSEGSEKQLDYFVVEDLESLLYVANSAAIPLHVWSSRVVTLNQPDWCILDLDPKGAPFTDVVKVARVIRKVCEEIELPTYVKTSGSSGLHVLIPLGRQCSYEQSRMLGNLLARVAVAELPDIATVTRAIRSREGKVYVDFLQNGHGQLLVAPFCVRPVPEAAVSTPLRWSEVTNKLDIRKHTIRSVPKRMKRLEGGDPLLGVLNDKPDLAGALERLARRSVE